MGCIHFLHMQLLKSVEVNIAAKIFFSFSKHKYFYRLKLNVKPHFKLSEHDLMIWKSSNNFCVVLKSCTQQAITL